LFINYLGRNKLQCLMLFQLCLVSLQKTELKVTPRMLKRKNYEIILVLKILKKNILFLFEHFFKHGFSKNI